MLCDPLQGNSLLLVADQIYILSHIIHPVIPSRHTAECDHLPGFALERAFHPVSPGSDRLLLIRPGKHSRGAPLAYIELDRADLHAEAVFDQIFQIFPGTCEHLVPERVHAHIARQLTDKSPFPVIDPLGDADDHIRRFLKRRLHISDELLCVKRSLRQVDEHRVIPLIPARQSAGSSQPSRVASHDLHDSDRFFIIIHRRVHCDLPDRRRHILRRAPESRGVVRLYKVIVYRLRDPHKTDITACLLRIARQLAHSIHGIISPDIKEISDPILLKPFEQLRVHFILQIFRQFISA